MKLFGPRAEHMKIVLTGMTMLALASMSLAAEQNNPQIPTPDQRKASRALQASPSGQQFGTISGTVLD
jgi:hypothetical protein